MSSTTPPPSAADILSPYYCSYEWVGAIPFAGGLGAPSTPPPTEQDLTAAQEQPTPLVTTSSLREVGQASTTNQQFLSPNPLTLGLVGVSVVIGAAAVIMVVRMMLKK